MVWLPVLCFPVPLLGLLGLATENLHLTSKVKSGGLSFAFEVQYEVCHVSLYVWRYHIIRQSYWHVWPSCSQRLQLPLGRPSRSQRILTNISLD